jgi:hypothetical protein
MHAKLLWAAIFSAAQTTLYWGTVSWLLQIPNAWGATWLLLFVVALLSNLIALNLSDTFTQPVPIYILIPILLIPQLVLSGAVIPYEKFNPVLRGKRPIPLLADISISRWAYESALVLHYTHSPYVQALYPIRREISDLRYQLLYLIPALESRQDLSLLQQTGDTSYTTLSTKLRARLQRLQTKLLAVENQLPEALRQKYHNAALEDLLLATHTPPPNSFGYVTVLSASTNPSLSRTRTPTTPRSASAKSPSAKPSSTPLTTTSSSSSSWESAYGCCFSSACSIICF